MAIRPNDTIVINLFNSYCNNCHKPADPNEGAHTTVLELVPNISTEGCGVTWTYVSSDYIGKDVEQRIQNQWPQYTWIGWN